MCKMEKKQMCFPPRIIAKIKEIMYVKHSHMATL